MELAHLFSMNYHWNSLYASPFLIITEFLHSYVSEFTSSHFVSHFHTIILSMLVLAIYLFRIFLYYNEFLTFLFSFLLPGRYWPVKVSSFQGAICFMGGSCAQFMGLSMWLWRDKSIKFKDIIRKSIQIPWRFSQGGAEVMGVGQTPRGGIRKKVKTTSWG